MLALATTANIPTSCITKLWITTGTLSKPNRSIERDGCVSRLARAQGSLARSTSAPLKAFNQLGASPDQGNVTALYPTVVTAFP